jgi:hypothetical protein
MWHFVPLLAALFALGGTLMQAFDNLGQPTSSIKVRQNGWPAGSAKTRQ